MHILLLLKTHNGVSYYSISGMATQIPELGLCHIIITEKIGYAPNSSLGEANMVSVDVMYWCLCVWLGGDEWMDGNKKN